MLTVILLTMGAALAQDLTADQLPAITEDPPPQAGTWLAFEATHPAGAQVPKVFRTLESAGCFCHSVTSHGTPAATHLPGEVSQFAELRVEVRRGTTRLVSVASSTPGMEDLMPCIHTQLASIEWGVRRADLDLRVSPANPPTPTDAAPGAQAPTPDREGR